MELKSEINIPVKGKYSLSVLKDGVPVEGKQIKETQNIVSYEGAAAMFTPVVGIDNADSMYARVGTGSVERVRTDTGLGSVIAGQSDSASAPRSGWSEVDNLDGTTTISITRNLPFSVGEIVDTISEVGLFHSTGGEIFIAGQLIKDEMGNPTTVTILADEQLIVTYTLEITGPLEPTVIGSGTVDADGVSTDYSIYAQPMLKFYAINGSTDNTVRYEDDANRYAAIRSNGTTVLSNKAFSSSNVTHNGTGTVSWNNSTINFSPSDFSSNDVKYIVVSGSTSYGDINTTTVLEEEGTFNQALVICEFTPAIDKPGDKTLSMDIDFSITV